MYKKLYAFIVISLMSVFAYAKEQAVITQITTTNINHEKKICNMTQSQAYHQLLFDVSPEDRITYQDEYQALTEKAYQGDLASQLHLGEAFNGYDKTECFFNIVAKFDDENGKMARYGLFRYYFNGFHDFPVDKEKGFYWLERLGEIEPEAHYTVGHTYHFAMLNIDPNSDMAKEYAQKAISWYLKASQAGDPRASHNIAKLYYMGMGLEVDRDKVVQWLNTTIQQSLDIIKLDSAGSFEEQWVLHESYESLGDLYFFEKDYDKAMNFYMNDINAEPESHASRSYYQIGQMYKQGLGVKKDINQAKIYYKKACENGISEACNLK